MTTSRRSSSPSSARWETIGVDATLLVLALALAALLPHVLRFSNSLVLKLGPLDQTYTQGFRDQAEREGSTWFHWTGVASRLHLPFVLRGDGFTLSLRARRHFVEPAHVKLRVEDRVVHAFDLQAQDGAAYHTVSVPLGPLSGARPFRLDIEAPSENSRPLGIALDWVEIRRSGAAEIQLLPGTRLRIMLVALAALLIPLLAGAGRPLSILHAVVMLAGMGSLLVRDPVACERILSQGAGAYLSVGLLALALARSRKFARALGTEDLGAVCVIVMAALAIRLTLLLHPAFFYPDLLVHSRFTWQLVRTGLGRFLGEYIRHQYQFSLGLQNVGGHWYALPYPPLLYLISAPLVRLVGYSPETAVEVVASSLNSLEGFLFFALALRLSGARRIALATAALLPTLPIFLTRLALAYYPAISGGALDMALLLWLASSFERFREPRRILGLGIALALVFLTYTQSLLNFGVLLGIFLPWQWLRDRDSRRAVLGVLGGCFFAGVLVFGLFYYRYVPGIVAMRQGTAPAEESVLLDKPAAPEAEARVPEEEKNPFFGPDYDLWRGFRKGAFRLWVFWGPFAFAIPLGLILVLRGTTDAGRRLVTAWALHYLVMNLGSGGLPSPNLLRYNKEMEFVAALFCLALATLGFWIWDRVRPVAAGYGAAFLLWTIWQIAPFFGGSLPREL